MFIYKAGVVGAGAMGSGIAQVISFSGLPVVLKDTDQERVDKGLQWDASRLQRKEPRPRGHHDARPPERTTGDRRKEERSMLPFLTPDRADATFQMVMMLMAAFTVVCGSLATWFRA